MIKPANVVVLACLCLGMALSACVPTGGSDPPPPNPTEATAVVPVTPLSGSFVVAADVAVARTGPSLDATILVSYKAGDVVQVIGLHGAETWYRVATEEGEGWIFASFLTKQTEVTDETEAPVTPTAPRPTATTKRDESTRVPSQTPTVCAGAPAGWVQYRVQSGDTLAGLAGATGTSAAELRQANCMDPSDNTIYAGLPIWVPRLPPPTAPPPDTPTVTVTAAPTATPTATPTKFEPPPRVRPTETRRAEP